MVTKLPPDDPRNPAAYTKAVVYAAKAIQSGTANEDQQIRFMRWLVNECCCTYDVSFRPDPYFTAFAEGKSFVGKSVVKLLNLTGTVIDNLKD